MTLQGPDRRAVALLEQVGPGDAERPPGDTSLADVVRDLIEDPGDVWRRPWLAACTLLAIARSPGCGVDVAEFRGSGQDRAGWAIVSETLDGLLELPEPTTSIGGT